MRSVTSRSGGTAVSGQTLRFVLRGLEKDEGQFHQPDINEQGEKEEQA
jgi:hypothetical protein